MKREKKIPKCYKFYPETIEKIEKGAKATRRKNTGWLENAVAEQFERDFKEVKNG